jgi:hypothetical protein
MVQTNNRPQEDDMKNMIVVAAMIIGVSGAYAQDNGFFSTPARYQTADLGKAQQNYVVALKHYNEGLVEAGIAQVAMLGIMRPDCVCSKVRESLDELVASGSTTAIRYRAYLATMVLAHPSMFADEAHRTFENPDELFTEIGNRLNEQLIAGNAHDVD